MKTTFNVERAFGVPNLIGVLLSGGIDSTTALYMALDKLEGRDDPNHDVVAISFNYGQRHSKELDIAKAIADNCGVQHHVIDISGIIPNTMLKDPTQVIPDVDYSELKGVSPTYVPFRNGLMISAAISAITGILERRIQMEVYPQDAVAHVYAGIHEGDAAGFAYPDCTPEFAGALANAIWMGSYGRIRLVTPLINMEKALIVEVGDALKAPLSQTWSCYKGGAMHCGVCPTCRARKLAFEDACVDDDTVYEQ